MNHAEIESFLGAYALDALDPSEADVVTRHLEECPRCRAEVSAHLETVALLGNLGAEAPPGLWDRIAGDIAGGREEAPPLVTPLARPGRAVRPRSSGPRRMATVLLAAAAVVIALLAVDVVRLDRRVSRMQTAISAGGNERAAAAVLLSPDHRDVRLLSTDGQVKAEVVVAQNGDGYVVATNLPPLAGGRTYQLWGLAGGRVVSLGLLGGDPRLAGFRIDGAVSQLMVTAEPSGGVVVPDGAVLVQGEVASA